MGVGSLVKPGEEITADKINLKLENVESGDIVDFAVTTSKIATGAVITEKIGDFAVTSGKIATGAITTTKFAYHLGVVGPIPTTPTWYSFPYYSEIVPRQAIVTPTTGVVGFVVVNDLANTGIQLVASVSGVRAIVTIIW